LQPLVENAVKHGIAPMRAGGEVWITAHIASSMLVITVRDTGAGASRMQLMKGREAGVGLANIEQRLRLCCSAEAGLEVETEPGAGATIRLSLPVRSSRAKKAALAGGDF
jgi:sensor histidine kinase YesM